MLMLNLQTVQTKQERGRVIIHRDITKFFKKHKVLPGQKFKSVQLLEIELMGKFKFFLFYFFGLWDSSYRAALYTDSGSGDQFCHFLRLQWIVHPRLVKFKWTFGYTLFTITIGIHTSVSSMKHLEELILRLIIGAGITNAGK